MNSDDLKQLVEDRFDAARQSIVDQTSAGDDVLERFRDAARFSGGAAKAVIFMQRLISSDLDQIASVIDAGGDIDIDAVRKFVTDTIAATTLLEAVLMDDNGGSSDESESKTAHETVIRR